ncbi:MAG: hypothetical protein HYX68_06175 [Planctomycetes bacterium]|nr:hypothetical protein [Planctomycetota bacterium]
MNLCTQWGGQRSPFVKRRPLFVETLEDRTTPAFFNWTGTAGDNLWDTPGNWDQNVLPTIADDVSINQASADILVNQAGAARSISMMTSVNLVVNNSLTIDQNANISGQMKVAGTLTANANASLWPSGGMDVRGDINLDTGSQLTLMNGNSILGDGAAITGAGLVSFGMGSVTVEGTATIENLTMTGGDLQGPGALTITGTMNWQGGNLSSNSYPGTLNIADTATLNISGFNNNIQGWTVNIDGIANWTQGDVGNEASTINVGALGEFNISVSYGTWRDTYQDGLSTINNYGTINSVGGMAGMPVAIEPGLNLTGAAFINAGSIELRGGGWFNVDLEIAPNAEVVLDNGLFVAEKIQQPGANQAGRFVVGNGGDARLEVPVNQVAFAKRIELRAGGTIAGFGELRILHSLVWTAGQMEGNGTTVFDVDAMVTIDGSVRSDDRAIENRGGMAIQFGRTLTIVRTNLNNTGWIQLKDQARIRDGLNDPQQPATLVNSGDLGVVSGQAVVDIVMDQQGNVTVLEGQLRLARSVTVAPGGVLFVDSQAILALDNNGVLPAPIYSFAANSTITGSGRVIYSDGGGGGRISLNANAEIYIANFTMGSGTIAGPGVLNVANCEWESGFVSNGASINVAAGGTMNITGALDVNNATVVNYGTVNWTAPVPIRLANDAKIKTNGMWGQGDFNVLTAQQILDISPLGAPTPRLEIENAGVFRKISGGQNVIWIPIFNLGGTLDAGVGDFQMEEDYFFNGGTTTAGLGGNLDFKKTVIQTFGDTFIAGTMSASSLTIGGGTLTLGVSCCGLDGTLIAAVTNYGLIQGRGAIVGNVENQASLAPTGGAGEMGALLIAGNYTQGSTGTLVVSLAGTQSGEYDTLTVTGNVTLAGTLSVALSGGFLPLPGDAFDILEYFGQRQGTFDLVIGNGNNFPWTVSYDTEGKVIVGI